MAKIIVEISFDEKVADDIHGYMLETTKGNYGFFDVIQDNLVDLMKSIDSTSEVRIIEVIQWI